MRFRLPGGLPAIMRRLSTWTGEPLRLRDICGGGDTRRPEEWFLVCEIGVIIDLDMGNCKDFCERAFKRQAKYVQLKVIGLELKKNDTKLFVLEVCI